MPVPGNDSIRALQTKLIATFGDARFDFGDAISNEQDAFGWRLLQTRYVFSVSTEAGALPFGVYSLQVSIIDDSIDNGDVSFDDETDTNGVLYEVRRHSGWKS